MQPLRDEYLQALGAHDLRRSRRLIVDAVDRGASPGRLYADVVRPGIHQVAGGWTAGPETSEQRLALGSVAATMALVATRRPLDSTGAGQGRRAIVSIGASALDALDGQAIVDALAADGWSVDEVVCAAEAHEVAQLAERDRVELVVMPTCSAADLLLAAKTYTLLRRLPDPPLIVACSLGSSDDGRRARSAGADALVVDVEDLLEFIGARLPPVGRRNWGVRLGRRPGLLLVAPTGVLDSMSVTRLRQVVDSREGSFGGFVVDTRNVASATPDGVTALTEWLEARPSGGARLVADGPVADQLDRDRRGVASRVLMSADEIGATL